MKPQNMTYLVGSGRLCAFAIVSKNGATYVGVPKTDIEGQRRDVLQNISSSSRTRSECSCAYAYRERTEVETGKAGVENTFLRVSMLGMLKHPHAKPENEHLQMTVLMTELKIIKSSDEIEKIRRAARLLIRQWKLL